MYFEALGPMYKRLQITEEMTHLPEETDQIWVDFTRNDESRDLDERTIIRLLRNLSNKVKEVQVKNISDGLSPERVEILEVIIIRAEKLLIFQWYSDLAYSCLTSCLSQPNGLKELWFLPGGFGQISIDQAQLLFQGVASSSCLKVLSLGQATFEPDDEEEEIYESICNAFLDALERNRSLETLDFDVTPFVTTDWGIFTRIFKAAILDAKIKSLSCLSRLGRFGFPSNLLIEALCNNECKLKELALRDCTIVQSLNDDDQMPNDAFNKSLEKLFFTTKNVDLTMMVEVARRCRSLVSLDLSNCGRNTASNLSLLDPLLIGDEQLLSLQRLELCHNGINEDQAIEFFRKLPQMTCIREVRLKYNPFAFYKAWLPVLVDAIQRNKSVEDLDLHWRFHMPELTKACSKMDDALRRNQERRLTEEFLALARSEVLPEKLWPLVLERAQKPIPLNLRKTYTREWVEQPSESAMQNDLVYRLLKEKMLQDHLY